MLSTVAPHFLHLNAEEPAGCLDTISIARRFASALTSALTSAGVDCFLFDDEFWFNESFDVLKMPNMNTPRDRQSRRCRIVKQSDQRNAASPMHKSLRHRKHAERHRRRSCPRILVATPLQVMVFSRQLAPPGGETGFVCRLQRAKMSRSVVENNRNSGASRLVWRVIGVAICARDNLTQAHSISQWYTTQRKISGHFKDRLTTVESKRLPWCVSPSSFPSVAELSRTYWSDSPKTLIENWRSLLCSISKRLEKNS